MLAAVFGTTRTTAICVAAVVELHPIPTLWKAGWTTVETPRCRVPLDIRRIVEILHFI
jgi:hypothetical protein